MNTSFFGAIERNISDISEIENLILSSEKFIFGDYCVVPDAGRFTAMVVRLSNRSRMGFKIISNYKYRNIEQCVSNVILFFNNLAESQNSKREKALEAKTFRVDCIKNINSFISKGDVYYSSWGYEQTNVDFFQVIDFSPKGMVSLRAIKGEIIDGTEDFNYGQIRPLLNEFKSDEIIQRRISFYGDKSYFKSKNTWNNLSKYQRGDKGVYCSWGY